MLRTSKMCSLWGTMSIHCSLAKIRPLKSQRKRSRRPRSTGYGSESREVAKAPVANEADMGDTQSQKAFWDAFRAGVRSNNHKQVADLTRFPLKTRGPMDSDPVETYGRAGFLKVYNKLVRQEVYSNNDAELQSHTMRQIVEAQTLTPKLDQGEKFSVEQFDFEKLEGKWRFVFAYLEDGFFEAPPFLQQTTMSREA